MKKEKHISNITIEYNNDNQTKERFIKFIIDYLLEINAFGDDSDGGEN